jgi:hypothetical protein
MLFEGNQYIYTSYRHDLWFDFNGVRSVGGQSSLIITPRIWIMDVNVAVLLLQFEYTNPDWIFINRAVFMNAAGQRLTIDFKDNITRRISRSGNKVSIEETAIVPIGIDLRLIPELRFLLSKDRGLTNDKTVN